MINEDDIYVCDFCGEDVGKFNQETGNHVSCEELEELKKVNEKQKNALEKIIEKTDKWIEQGTINHPPWWNLGDIAYVGLGRKRPTEKSQK